MCIGEEFERLCSEKDKPIIEALANSNQKFSEFVEIRKVKGAGREDRPERGALTVWVL